MKTAEPTGDLIGNKIFRYVYKGHITNVSSESVKPIIIDQFRLTWYINRMEHQKIINLLVNETITPSKFRAKDWVEIMMTHMEQITLLSKLN